MLFFRNYTKAQRYFESTENVLIKICQWAMMSSFWTISLKRVNRFRKSFRQKKIVDIGEHTGEVWFHSVWWRHHTSKKRPCFCPSVTFVLGYFSFIDLEDLGCKISGFLDTYLFLLNFPSFGVFFDPPDHHRQKLKILARQSLTTTVLEFSRKFGWNLLAIFGEFLLKKRRNRRILKFPCAMHGVG